MATPPRILTIAGSDSSGGAGIEADIKVITAHKCYGMTVMTGLTAQNTTGVFDIHPIPVDFLRKTITAVLEDVGADVIKTGMLTSAAHIAVIVETIQKYNVKSIVLDPVMISTSGSALLPTDAISALCQSLIPLATIITPNIPEAQHLLAHYATPDNSQPSLNTIPATETIKSMADVVNLAKRLQEHCSVAVLVKGGHIPFASDGSIARRTKEKAAIMDVLVLPGGHVKVFNSSYVNSSNTHGTGCSLASAIACNIGLLQPLPTAVFNARNYISGAIAAAFPIGKGSGPINHMHNLYQLPYSKGNFLDYLITHPRVAHHWDAYVNHEFVKRIANGTIGIDRFTWYLKQDYLYLVQFARAAALLTYKSPTLSQMNIHAESLSGIIRETLLHINYCAELIPGVTEEDLRLTPEAPTTTAYSRYILDVGNNGDMAALMVALISCAVGYGVAARNRETEEGSVTFEEGNIFWKWIEEYGGDKYTKAVQIQRDTLEELAVGLGIKQVEDLVEIFAKVTEMECSFFTAALEAKV